MTSMTNTRNMIGNHQKRIDTETTTMNIKTTKKINSIASMKRIGTTTARTSIETKNQNTEIDRLEIDGGRIYQEREEAETCSSGI